ncbi:hypothetical protein ACFE04_028853 [Oxalis oulophora]
MLNGPSQICIHFLGSRMFGERNPYIPTTFVKAHTDIIPDKMKLYSWEGRVWDVDIQRVRTGGLTQCPVQCLPYHPPSPPPPADPKPAASALRHVSEDTSMSSTFMILDREDETIEPSVYQSSATGLAVEDVDGTQNSLSEELKFRHAPDQKKFRVIKRPRSGSIGGFNSLRIPTVFVRRNINYLEQPSQCVLKITFVSEIECSLTWGKRGYPYEVCINELWSQLEKSFRFVKGMYLEFLIAEPNGEEGGIVLQLIVFNSDGTVCQPNVHRI